MEVADTALREFVFKGAINNYPSDDVQEDNDNYLAGVREIGVRSEYTDGRDRPRLRVRSVEFEGPFYESWPPATHRRIFIGSANEDKPEVYAREIVRYSLNVCLNVCDTCSGNSHNSLNTQEARSTNPPKLLFRKGRRRS